MKRIRKITVWQMPDGALCRREDALHYGMDLFKDKCRDLVMSFRNASEAQEPMNFLQSHLSEFAELYQLQKDLTALEKEEEKTRVRAV